VFAVLPVCGDFQRRRQHYSATTAHRALPLCDWPALNMPWGTERLNEAFAMYNRCGGACTGCCGKARQVVGGGHGFAGLWRFPDEEAALSNHSAQSSASVWVVSPGHAMGHCKARCGLCSVQQVWWILFLMLQHGWAGGLWGLQFCPYVKFTRGGCSTQQPQRTEPC